MLDLFLCHSPLRRREASKLAERLERCTEARVWREEVSSSCTVLDAWEGGLSSSAVLLLLLSPDIVPQAPTRANWEPVLQHLAQNAEPPLVCVVVEPCAYPSLLARKNFYQWSDNVDFVRTLEQRVMQLHAQNGPESPAPLSIPADATTHAPVLDTLFEKLVDEGGGACTLLGPANAGKTNLAQQFAHAAYGHFRDVLWIACGDLPESFIVGDLGTRLGATDPRLIPTLLADHRLLLVLDDLRFPLPPQMTEGGRTSVLVTTREERLRTGFTIPLSGAAHQHVSLDTQSHDQAIWEAIAVCDRNSASLPLIAQIAGAPIAQAREAIDRLATNRLLRHLDVTRVRRTSDAANVSDELRRKHAHAVANDVDANIREVPAALMFTCEHDWPLAQSMGQRAADLLRFKHRNEEAAFILEVLRAEAKSHADAPAAKHFDWELSWLRSADDRVRPPALQGGEVQLSLFG